MKCSSTQRSFLQAIRLLSTLNLNLIIKTIILKDKESSLNVDWFPRVHGRFLSVGHYHFPGNKFPERGFRNRTALFTNSPAFLDACRSVTAREVSLHHHERPPFILSFAWNTITYSKWSRIRIHSFTITARSATDRALFIELSVRLTITFALITARELDTRGIT